MNTEWGGGIGGAVQEMHAGAHARLAPFPLWVHAEYWRTNGHVWRSARRSGWEPMHGAIYPDVSPCDWYPDLETNTPSEVMDWATAAKAARQGAAVAIEPSNPAHPFGCTAFHGFGLGVCFVYVGDDPDDGGEELLPEEAVA